MQQKSVGERSVFAPVHEGPEGPENGIIEILACIERSIDAMAQGLSLVGVKRCSRCRRFFKADEAGALFDGGRLVCFGCIPEWWPQRSEQLDLAERRDAESRLVYWLRKHHQAETVKQSAKLAEDQVQILRMPATCQQCRGAGVLLGSQRCRYCDGPGTVWVLVPGWTAMKAGAA